MHRITRLLATAFLFVLFTGSFSCPAKADEKELDQSQPQYGVALHGAPKYPADFKHLDYVNPDAPKGGTLHVGAVGTFDSLNPFIVKGNPAPGVSVNYLRSGLVYESLMQNTWDEPFSLYGIIAKSIQIAPDRSWVTFELRDEATWNDGVPITADDVVWTFETLTTKGQPFFQAYWHDVESATAEGPKRVTFKFKVKGNAELPLIVAEMTILPKHYWTADGHNFEDSSSLVPPLTSGPYTFGKIDAPRSIEYVRNENWWGKNLPFFKGMNNFDRVVYDLYLDEKVMHEAFLSGNFDFKMENSEHQWQTTYDVPAVKDGRLIKELIDNSRPAGMQAFIFNIRRPVFQDIKVREALNYALDFEWSNKQFAYGAYTRTNSYFANSELASSGLPSEAELKILESYRGKIPDEVFTSEYKSPVTDGTGNARANLKKAADILEAAGYKLGPDKIRVKQTENGPLRLEFELLSDSPMFERWIQPFIKNLERIGVKAKLRTITDSAQMQNRMNDYDFDMTIATFGQSDSPGNEQREFWGSDKADVPGSRNYIGVKNPVIDEIVTQLIHAESREDLVTKTRALDRVLLWNYYVIPMWHYNKWRMAYWKKLKRPEHLSGLDPLVVQTWWIDPASVKPDSGSK
ncbi:MAG: ABC transporter substrate-binding protein [Rhodospirillales bacterium]|nr:ABC transporter substrate-binding protein [Alphaproteobacteria bacterium]MCB9976244.1 ABC transporter substrate-binding protein [Rhodospirillales bacterium]